MQTIENPALTTDASRELDARLRNLHRELRAVLGLLPVEAQTASGLARFLRIERTTCQRSVSAVTQPYSGLALAGQLPGPRGLRLLLEAIRRRATASPAMSDAAAALQTAIDQYELATRRAAGSRSDLLRLIEGASQAAQVNGADDARARRALFDAAAALTGRQSETWLAVHIYEPLGDAERLMQTRAHGLIGHAARDDAVPLTLHVIPPDAVGGDDEGLVALLEPESADGAPAEVLRAFSTLPLPIVRSQHPNEFIVQTVDRNPAQATATPFDLLFAMRGPMPHPKSTPSQLEEIWALINFPVRRLLLDVFLHRDLARDCIPGLDVHLWRPDFAAHVGERWQTRFARGPTLQVLGAGLAQAATAAHVRHVELLNVLFTARGLDPAQYIGFRCAADFPMWRTGYRVTLDFGGGR